MPIKPMQQYELSFRVDWEDREVLRAPFTPEALNNRLRHCYHGCGYQEDVPSTLSGLIGDKLVQMWFDESRSMPSIRLMARTGGVAIMMEWYGVYSSHMTCVMSHPQDNPEWDEVVKMIKSGENPEPRTKESLPVTVRARW